MVFFFFFAKIMVSSWAPDLLTSKRVVETMFVDLYFVQNKRGNGRKRQCGTPKKKKKKLCLGLFFFRVCVAVFRIVWCITWTGAPPTRARSFAYHASKRTFFPFDMYVLFASASHSSCERMLKEREKEVRQDISLPTVAQCVISRNFTLRANEKANVATVCCSNAVD